MVINVGVELLEVLRKCSAPETPTHVRAAACQQLVDMVKSQRVRDVDQLPRGTYSLLFECVHMGWESPEGEMRNDVQVAFAGLTRIPEFKTAEASDYVKDGFLSQLSGRFREGLAEERLFLRDTLHWVYSNFSRARGFLRGQIGAVLRQFARAPNRKTHVAEMLQVLRSIIRGFPEHLTQVHRSLLTGILLPLHEPNQMAVWSLQQPLIESYHEALVGCLVPFIEKQPDLAKVVLESVVAAWPEGFQSNTAKEVLLLHEMETLMKLTPSSALESLMVIVMPKILGCLRVYNSRVVERALFIFKDDSFLSIMGNQPGVTLEPLLAALLRGGEPFWNPTVTKMTAHVLERLEEMHPEAFAIACESVWGEDGVAHEDQDDQHLSHKELISREGAGEAACVPHVPQVTGSTHSSHMGLGVATRGRRSEAGGMKGLSRSSKASGNPPLTITGVAPWAFETLQSNEHRASRRLESVRDVPKSKSSPGQTLKRPLSSSLDPSGDNEPRRGGHADEDAATNRGKGRGQGSGLRKVRQYIRQLRPKEADEPSGPSWLEVQLEETPTLLPDLRKPVAAPIVCGLAPQSSEILEIFVATPHRIGTDPDFLQKLGFHDLVFGQELGQGSFSSVRYARQITKGKTRSAWPEFAVKIISTTKIQELHYERSVTNEIACLRLFSHPGIARLISSFRWRDGAYLVLEYASRGDLHTQVKEHGSLSTESTRFVIGEVVAALCSIHDRGFVFGDLKPENILITESGHIKIADFGACRAVTADAKEFLKTSRNVLRTLRDGDWRTTAGLPPDPKYAPPLAEERENDSDDEVEMGEDTDQDTEASAAELQTEGTAAYLPPEVINGSAPNFGADAWALGCVAYFCVAGRPPIFAETNEAIMARVVRFMPVLTDNLGQSVGGASGTLPPDTPNALRSFICSLMEPDQLRRLSVDAAAKHVFFSDSGIDLYSLYRREPVELARGTVAPTPNAAWSRRQNSMIWAPMPEEYRFDELQQELDIIPETDVESKIRFQRHITPIAETTSSNT